jgi:hypothetical protein
MNSTMSLSEVLSLKIEEQDIVLERHNFEIHSTFFDFRPIRAVELYGVMRPRLNRVIDFVKYCEANNFVYIEIWYNIPAPSFQNGIRISVFADYFVLTDCEMSLFLEHYCNIQKKYVNWKKEGF